jgi:flagellar basal body P-ring protein FlgI
MIWVNERPGSIVNCRPIKIEHVKESSEGTRQHVNAVQNQMDNIKNTVVTIDNTKIVNVQHKKWQCSQI